MNRRPALLAAATLTAAAVLSLSACGGGDDGSKGDDRIDGAGSGESASAKPSPSASDDGIDRPEIRLPKDLKNVFEGRRTGDPKKDAVLADNERRVNSVAEAITVDKKDHPALKFYSSGDALVSSASYIKSFYDDGRSVGGTTRYYDRKVTFLKKDVAAVTYCMDGSGAYSKDRETGKAQKPDAPSPSDYFFYNTRLEKNPKGVWVTTSVSSIAKAKQCM
ncbi:hypothetical protein [Streptomyces sp. G45]|uniref:hypothetical protein n=1 Tax=Streptomyces sp. G45 TaxID=3406627 RepID=UPI003C1F419D